MSGNIPQTTRIIFNHARYNTTPNMDDSALLTRIAGGNKAAFRIFMSRHLAALVSFIMRFIPVRADAEDVAQDAFLRVWQHAARWQPSEGTPLSWLYRITYNRCIDILRRIRPSTSEIDELHSDHTPEQALERDERHRKLQYAITDLPERQRTALWLCTYQGLSNKDAAATLGVSIDALESLLARARRHLRLTLRETTALSEDKS